MSEISDLANSVGLDKIEIDLDDESRLNSEDRKIIKTAIEKSRYDVEYHKFLNSIGTYDDIFAIVIDTEGRDNEARTNIDDIINNCIAKEYKCFLSNPCFEFFLLLHTYNPIEEYNKVPEKFINNPVVSNSHTYVSKIVSEHHGHGKKISEKKFKEIYLKNISQALSNSYSWAHTLEDVKNNVGSNMIELFRLLMKKDI